MYLRLVILSLVIATKARAQLACGYQFAQRTDIAYQHLPEESPTRELVSGGLEPGISDTLSPSDEEFFENQSIGFNFTFNGNTYSSIGIASNGYVWFGNESPFRLSGIVYPYTNILQSDYPFDGVISALNADLEGRWSGENASIRTRTNGVAPNRTFTIEWRNFKIQGDAEAVGFCGELRNRFDFQIKLLEQNSEIQIAYNTSPYCFQGFEAFFQIGLRGNSSSDVHTRQVNPGNTAWLTSQLGFSPSTAVMRSSAPVTLPVANLSYTFKPGLADSLVWLGINSNWFDSQNWSGNTIPGRCNGVYIPAGLNNYPILSGAQAASCGNLTIAAGAALECSGEFSAHLTIFGSLRNDGALSNSAASFISLAGNSAQNEISGSGIFTAADLFLTAASTYSIGNDLIVRSININAESTLRLNTHVLDVFSFQQSGIIDQQNGILILEGHPQHIQLNDSTFFASQGTTCFGNGELWNMPGNQLVPSLHYHNLWIRTNKDFTVQLGDNGEFSCHNLAFYNPGERGGVAETASNLVVSGVISLGADSLPGTVFIINHNIHQTNGNSPFETGASDALIIRHASNVQRAITGSGMRKFDGTVSYQSDQTQAVVKGDYRNLSIQGQGERINSGKLTVKGIMRLEAGTFQTGDSLVLKSDEQGTALISGVGTGTLQGKALLQRYIHGDAIQHVNLSSPINAINWSENEALTESLESNPYFWSFDGLPSINGFASAWIIRQQQELVFEAMKAYRSKVQGGTTLQFFGNFNSGNFFLPLPYTANSAESVWSNAGNPYPSPIDWNKVYSEQSEHILPGIVKVASNPQFNGSYAAWLVTGNNEGIGINGAKPWISSAEGFFVQSKANDTLRLNNAHRAELVSIDTASRSCSLPLVLLKMQQGDTHDELAVYFHPNGNNTAYNDLCDLQKPAPLAMQSFWYSLKGNKKLGIQSRNQGNPNDTIPLSISVAQSGNVYISLKEALNIPATAKLVLEDRATNSSYNLKLNPSVSFTLSEGLHEGRFYLHYAKGISISTLNAGCDGQSGSIALVNEGTQNWQASVFQGNVEISNLGNVSNEAMLGNLSPGNYRIEFVQGVLLVEELVTIEQGDQILANIVSVSETMLPLNQPAILKCNANEAEFISWSMGDGAFLQGLDSVNYMYQEPGDYTVLLSLARGLCNDTAALTMHITNPTGLEPATIRAEEIQVYPNPASEFTRISLEAIGSKEDLTLLIVDRSGKVVREIGVGKGSSEVNIPLNNVTSGRYEIILSGKTIRKTGSLQVLKK
ncbi:MAG: T9SS type A sorting domain-containing protein [Bacteroidia bacterium]